MLKSLCFWFVPIILVCGLFGCGTPSKEPQSSESSSQGSLSYSSVSSSRSESSSSISTVDYEPVAIQHKAGYTKIPSGVPGLTNVQATSVNWPEFDRRQSFSAFSQTLYPHLQTEGCVNCHSNDTDAQAPLFSDSNVSLAHEYALSAINFFSPEKSRFVEKLSIERHHCHQTGCAESADRMLLFVKAWVDQIRHMVPNAERAIEQEKILTEEKIGRWISDDKSKLEEQQLPYMVYVSLHELHNEGLSAVELNIVRTALSKALNSTARWAPTLSHPKDVNGWGMVYRFDIRDYWGFNQGVKRLLFGGSDDDLAFGDGKFDYLGERIDVGVQQQKFDFTGETTVDPDHALRIWQRVLHGNIEGAAQTGSLAPNIEGFHGVRSENASGEYVGIDQLEWVEAAQLIYTLSRPDVYNAIMMNPFYADELESNLEVDISQGMDSYDYALIQDAATVDSRMLWRAKRKSGGYYWKTWNLMTGYLASGKDRSIYDVYADPAGDDIRYPFWANPIPKFVSPSEVAEDTTTYSFVASLAQTYSDNGGFGFSGSAAPGCDGQPGFVQGFGLCRHYTGTGGVQQSESDVIYDLPNGMQAYYMSGAFNQRRVNQFTNVQRDPRLLPNASDDIAYMTGYAYSVSSSGSSNAVRSADPRLNLGSSCFSCHQDGIKRMNNDLRRWLDHAPEKLPSGPYGVDGWLHEDDVVARVRELYTPNLEWKLMVEKDREGYLSKLGEIKEVMNIGENKEIYQEPIIWTVEYVQRHKYMYPQTVSN